MKGYWGDPDRTRETVVDGWMRTGDLATIDRDGYCRIVGRGVDMLIRGGENVYPAEIENFLTAHPDIAEAAVFGVPDAKLGEEGLRLDHPQHRPHADRGRAPQILRRAHRALQNPPLCAVRRFHAADRHGKPQKYRMQEQMIAELGLRGTDRQTASVSS